MIPFWQIACSLDGRHIATAESKSTVCVWDVVGNVHISTFDTTLDYGGARLAISSDGANCIVGAYRVHGIASYAAKYGSERWRRKDLKKVQHIRILLDNKLVFCGFDEKAGHILNCETGETEFTLRGVREIRQSPYEQITLMCRDNRDFELHSGSGACVVSFPRAAFALLDAAFAPGRIGITESGGPVRCIGIESGRECWRFVPLRGEHALKIAYSELDNCFYCVFWSYERGGPKQIRRLREHDGVVVSVVELGESHKEEFCLEGTCLVDSSGNIWSLSAGAVTGTVATLK